MRIARCIVASLAKARKLAEARRIGIELQGSLTLTTLGHPTLMRHHRWNLWFPKLQGSLNRFFR